MGRRVGTIHERRVATQHRRLAEDIAGIRSAVELGVLCAELGGVTVCGADEAAGRTLAATAHHAEEAPDGDEEVVVLVKQLTEAYMERMTNLVDGCLSRLTTELEKQAGCTTRTGEQS